MWIVHIPKMFHFLVRAIVLMEQLIQQYIWKKLWRFKPYFALRLTPEGTRIWPRPAVVYRVGVRVAHKRRASKSPPKGLKRVGQDSRALFPEREVERKCIPVTVICYMLTWRAYAIAVFSCWKGLLSILKSKLHVRSEVDSCRGRAKRTP